MNVMVYSSSWLETAAVVVSRAEEAGMIIGRSADLPAGLRVLVAGGTVIADADADVIEFCEELGRALIEERAGGVRTVVMTGGSGDADRAVVQGAASAVRDARGMPHDRIVTFPAPNASAVPAPFTTTRIVPITWSTRQERRFAMAAAADLVIAVAGGPGTREEIVLARALGRPCLALPFTGGSARKAWDLDRGDRTMRRPFGRWDSYLDRWEELERPAGTERNELARQVAQVAVDSAGLPCFVGMPYTKRAEKLWAGLVEDAIRDAGMRADRADHSSETGSVTEEMLQRIRSASVVCGLLSDERYTYGRAPSVNPNVFYEIGYAHAHDKPTVLVVDHSDQVPFDLRHHRHVVIGRTTTPADHARLVDVLRTSRDLSPGSPSSMSWTIPDGPDRSR